jgi:enoyl-CoA hydratase/carnithine racemase
VNQTVLRADQDGVAVLILNRPAAMNTLNAAAFAALRQHIDDLANAAGAVGCVVLRGAGANFCAGLDLKEVAEVPVTPESHAFRAATIDALAALPMPVIAAVHGVCFTGALELALAADLIIATETARFADTHARFGFTPLWGMSQRLPRRIGIAAASDMMFTGREISGRDAQSIGLVNRCVPPGEFEAAWRGYAAEVTRHSWPSLVEQKRLIHEGAAKSLAAGLDYERATSPGAVGDSAARVAAFIARRAS